MPRRSAHAATMPAARSNDQHQQACLARRHADDVGQEEQQRDVDTAQEDRLAEIAGSVAHDMAVLFELGEGRSEIWHRVQDTPRP
jgi:hypothetical protein